MKNLLMTVLQIFKQSFLRRYLKYIVAILLFICIETVSSGIENLYKTKDDLYLISATEVSPYQHARALIKGSFYPNEFSNLNDSFKTSQASTQLPDSMYGIISNGHGKITLYKWYYFNSSEKLDTAKSNYYKANNEYNYYIGFRKYDSKGRLVTFIKQQPTYNANVEPYDSSIIDIYHEHYIYEGDKLVNNTLTYTRKQPFWIYTINYEYDSAGKLVRETKVRKTPESHLDYDYEYIYNADNQVIYIIDKEGSGSYNLQKNMYSFSDTLRITTQYFLNYLHGIVNFDSIAEWDRIQEFTETIDSLNRKTFLKVKTWQFFTSKPDEEKIFKAKYSYNESNKLESIVFYAPNDTLNLSFKEIFQEVFFYTKDGSILLYESTFFDERTNTWEIYERKTYYYSGLTTTIANKAKNTESNGLSIYPNPTSDIIHLQNIKGDNSHYTIYNIQGILVKKGNLVNSEINITELNRGIYILTIEINSTNYYERFIKK